MLYYVLNIESLNLKYNKNNNINNNNLRIL